MYGLFEHFDLLVPCGDFFLQFLSLFCFSHILLSRGLKELALIDGWSTLTTEFALVVHEGVLQLAIVDHDTLGHVTLLLDNAVCLFQEICGSSYLPCNHNWLLELTQINQDVPIYGFSGSKYEFLLELMILWWDGEPSNIDPGVLSTDILDQEGGIILQLHDQHTTRDHMIYV